MVRLDQSFKLILSKKPWFLESIFIHPCNIEDKKRDLVLLQFEYKQNIGFHDTWARYTWTILASYTDKWKIARNLKLLLGVHNSTSQSLGTL